MSPLNIICWVWLLWGHDLSPLDLFTDLQDRKGASSSGIVAISVSVPTKAGWLEHISLHPMLHLHQPNLSYETTIQCSDESSRTSQERSRLLVQGTMQMC